MYRCDGTIKTTEGVVSLCSYGQFCGIRKGVYGCHALPDGICQVSGFLHYTTFDGQHYSFQGSSTFVLLELCEASRFSPSFRVEVKNEKLSRVPLAVTSEVFVLVNNTQICLQRGRQGTVKIDKVAVSLPVTIQGLGITIYQHGFYTIVKTDFGLTVSYDMNHHGLFVTLAPAYQGQTCGLCGNFNGITDDDFVLRNGSTAKATMEFVLGWQLETAPGGADDFSASVPLFEQWQRLIHLKSMCWVIQNPNGPFASCHSEVDPEPYLTDCVFDLYISGEDSSLLCHSIQTYVAACQRANVTISPWRTESFCSFDCLANSHYELCGSPCQDICFHSWIKPHCLDICSEGCFCDRGYLRSGSSCIPEDQCGCLHNGLLYEIGNRVWLPGCQERCSCTGPSDFHCIPSSCNPGQTCTVKDGKVGCHTQWGTCTVTGDPHYFTFDGAVAHFQGTCAYEISRTCNSSLPFFYRIVAENRNWRNPQVSFVSRVEVWLKSSLLSFHIVLGRSQMVEVNQERVQPPYTLGPMGSITKIKNTVTIKAVANLEIQYNGRHTLFIHVGPEYQGKLCGMCGNFNSIHGDDKVLPDGNRAQNDLQFGNSWKTDTSPAGIINETLAPGQGNYWTAMTLYQDPQYSKPFTQSPILLMVNHRAYVSISISVQVNATHIIYSNVVQGHVENIYGGVISRDRFLFLSFSCTYPLNINLSMASVIHPIQDIFQFVPDLVEVYLHCRIRLCSFHTAKCTANCDLASPVIAGRKAPSGIISAGPFLRYDDSLDQGRSFFFNANAGAHERLS
ncbi:hypothetical protein JD844_005639 [Phrynosoma platyrhinos]|uniref:VWFD domain-containing protein n=1 Tax=Phrynosoma platyrhinos TaxID=52577 RepID=A0ABQ7TNT6_PHRPL|nr:hypothetical protein JD844_005639 [Phrynosoma platyrhinos]